MKTRSDDFTSTSAVLTLVMVTTPYYNYTKLSKRKELTLYASPKPTFIGRDTIYTTNLKKRSTMYGPKNRISFCTSESNIKWNSNYKPGDAVTFTLNNVSSAILRKEQESSGMGRWTYLTILGKYNRRTTIFTMYRQCKKSIRSIEDSTVTK